MPGKKNVVPDALSRPPDRHQQCNLVITLNDQPLLFRVIQRRQEAALQLDTDFAALYHRYSSEGGEQ